MQQFVQRPAATRGFQNAIERVQPHRSLQINLAQNRHQRLGYIGKVDFRVFHAGGCDLAEILHQQKVDFVADDVALGRLGQKVLQQTQQAFLRNHGAGLQKLTQLVNLNALVEGFEPVVGLLHGVFAGTVHARFKIGANLHVDDKLTRELEVNRIQLAGGVPLGCEILRRSGCGHGFTIQLGTAPRKRAATTVWPG